MTRLVDAALEASVVGSFTALGYDVRSRIDNWQAPQRLDGRVALVTGATSGLGYAYAKGLAGLGATTWFIARNETRAKAVREELIVATGNPDVQYLLCDMSDANAVRDVAASLRSQTTSLDVVVHNAGTIAPERRIVGGVESTVASQLLGPYVLTMILVDHLRTAAPGRVIFVASGGMYTQRFDLERLAALDGPFDGVRTYARVKRAQVVLTSAWARRFKPTSIAVAALHPGWVDTPGLRHSLPTFARLLGPWLRSPEQGADTGLWLAGASAMVRDSGAFWFDRRVRSPYHVPGTRPRFPQSDEEQLVAWLDAVAQPYLVA